MATLRIEYDPESQSAVLRYPERDGTWEGLRRVCEEYSDDVAVLGSSLRLPWWSFVAASRDIGYRLRAAGESLEVDPEAGKLLRQSREREATLLNLQPSTPYETEHVSRKIDGNFLIDRRLKSYQASNIASLTRLNIGATFSVPGAGKTTEALGFFALRASVNTRLLVVAPKNAFAAWEEQIQFWTMAQPFVRLAGGRAAIATALQRAPRFMLITYQQLTRVQRLIAMFLAEHETFVFLDESHKIKGGAEKITARSVLGLSYLATGRLIMSGTPMPNSVSDLVSQMQFLSPESSLNPENVVEFAKPLYVRTTKSQLNLPSSVRVLHSIPMRPVQERIYRLMKSEMARSSERSLRGADRQRLRRIGNNAMSLLQFTSNPALLLRRGVQYAEMLSEVLEEGDSPKLEFACERARQLAEGGRKVIIWSSFVENVEIIARRLQDLGADYIHGGVEAGSEEEEDTRERKIRVFHDDAYAMVLVANPAACSEGISLHTVCHNAIYVDRNYNAAQYLQSEDRIHRIGTSVAPRIDILSTPNSIDQSVDDRLHAKVARMSEVLNDPSLNIDHMQLDLDSDGFDDLDMQSVLGHLRDNS